MSDQNPVEMSAAAPEPEAPPPPRKRARWKKILLVCAGAFVALILAVLLAGPPIIASIAKSKIEGAVGEALGATVTVGDLSISWSGRVALSDLKIVPAGFQNPMLEVKSVEAYVSIGSAIGGSVIAEVDVTGPRLLVEKDAKGRFNYERGSTPAPVPAAAAAPSSPASEPAEKTFVQATLRVKEGEVVLREGSRETVFREIAIEVRLDTLDKPLEYALSLANPTHGKLALKGSFDLAAQAGPVSLTIEKLSLKNAAAAVALYGGVKELEGTVDGSFVYELKGGAKVTGKGRLDIDGLSATLDKKPAKFEKIVFTHDASMDAQGKGRHVAEFSAGPALSARFQADLQPGDALQGAADFKIESDLAALSDPLQGFVDLKEGVRLEGRALFQGRADAEGPGAARLDLSGTLTDLVALDKTRIEIDKLIGLKVRAAWSRPKPGDSEIKLEEMKLDSSFAALDAKGTIHLRADQPIPGVRETQVKLNSDLAKLGGKLASFLEKPPKLGGRVELNATVESERFTLDGALSKVVVDDLGPLDGTVVGKGDVETKPKGALRVESLKVVSKALEADLTGEIKEAMEPTRHGELRLAATVRPPELKSLMMTLDLGGPEIRLSGTIGLKGADLDVTGETRLDGLVWKDAAGVAQTAKTEPLTFKVEMKEKGIVARVATPSFVLDFGPTGGKLRGALEARITHGDKVSSGVTKISGFECTDGKTSFLDPTITLAHEIGLEPEAIEVRRVEVTSGFLNGSVSGRVENLPKAPRFRGVGGSLRYVPEKLGALLAPWVAFRMEGLEEKTLALKLDGEARTADVVGVLRGASGSVDVGLARLVHTGLGLSGQAHLEIKDAVMVCTTPLLVNDGKTDLNFSADFREKEKKPRSVLEFRMAEVSANAAMGPLLESLNPIFHTVNGTVDGVLAADFKLVWEGPVDPDEKDWTAASVRSLGGTGSLSCTRLAIAGSPVVGEILAALGESASRLEGELSAPRIAVGGGVVKYEGMLLRLKKYELRFSGWVGFDGKMELAVEMPLTDSLRKKNPNLEKYTGRTFFVPLRGSVDKPRFDFERALAELLKRALEGTVKEAVENKLQDVLKDKASNLLDDLFKKKK